MKKTFIIATLLLVGFATSFAVEYTAKAKIAYNGTTLTLREAATYSDGFDNGSDVLLYNTKGIEVAQEIAGQGDQWIQWASNDLEGVKIGFKANAAGEQTFSFSGVIGTLYLVDAVTGARTAIVNDGTYVFTAEAADVSAWNTTRFTISKVAAIAPYSFVNNTLVIKEANVGAEVTVTPFTYGAEGKNLGTPVIYNVPVNQVLNGGYFLVTYTNKEGVAREFIVNANPDVQPAND